MPIYVWFASALVAAAIPLLIWALSSEQTDESTGVRDRLSQGGRVDINFEGDLRGSGWTRIIEPLLLSLSDRSRSLTPAGMVTNLEHKADLAGIGPDWPTERILAMKVLLGGIGLALGLFLFAALSGPLGVVWLFLAPFASYMAIDVYLGFRADERQGEIARELPNVIDQISISVEAGLGFEAALSRSARSGHGPLADELARTLQDMQLGVNRAVALDRLVRRTDVPDLRSFVSSIRQAEQYGVPVADVLRVQAVELRDKRHSRAEERAMQIPVKMVFPMLLCILPVLFIVVIGPAGIRLVREFG